MVENWNNYTTIKSEDQCKWLLTTNKFTSILINMNHKALKHFILMFRETTDLVLPWYDCSSYVTQLLLTYPKWTLLFWRSLLDPWHSFRLQIFKTKNGLLAFCYPFFLYTIAEGRACKLNLERQVEDSKNTLSVYKC